MKKKNISTKMKATFHHLCKGTYIFALMLLACSPKVKTQNNQPLVIQEQGSFAFGGTVLTDSIGHQFHGDHAYVFYQKPVHPHPYPDAPHLWRQHSFLHLTDRHL